MNRLDSVTACPVGYINTPVAQHADTNQILDATGGLKVHIRVLEEPYVLCQFR